MARVTKVASDPVQEQKYLFRKIPILVSQRENYLHLFRENNSISVLKRYHENGIKMKVDDIRVVKKVLILAVTQ